MQFGRQSPKRLAFGNGRDSGSLHVGEISIVGAIYSIMSDDPRRGSKRPISIELELYNDANAFSALSRAALSFGAGLELVPKIAADSDRRRRRHC